MSLSNLFLKVQQPVDPSIFYTQYYCSGADSDARVSPFPIHEVASKYSGNVAVLSSQPPTEVCMLTLVFVKDFIS